MKILSNDAVIAVLIYIAILAFTVPVMAGGRSLGTSELVQIAKDDSSTSEVNANMKIHVTVNNKTVVFKLNNSQAAKDLYSQLPLNIKVENYSDSEKIFYPPKKLNASDAPLADAKAGTLAYYAPWGDVVMFYENFGSAAGLYELGQAVSGSELIKDMKGSIRIDKATSP